MKNSDNEILEFNILNFKKLPKAFAYFTDEEKEEWVKQECIKTLNYDDRDFLSNYTGNGIIIPGDQISNLDESFADVYNSYFRNRIVLIDIYGGGSYSPQDFSKIIRFYEKLKEGNNRLYFNEGSTIYSLEETFIANSKINEWVDQVNGKTIDGKPLSPLEKFYMAYDIITNFEYNESEVSFDARNMISILNGNKIVCVGYAKLLSALCKRLGIECECQLIAHNSETANHMNCIVRIKDEKYNINGVFYSDPCFDSKKHGKKTISHSLLNFNELKDLYGDDLKILPNKNDMTDYLTVDSKLKRAKSRKDLQALVPEFIASKKDDILSFVDSFYYNIDDSIEKITPTDSQIKELINLYIEVLSTKKLSKKDDMFATSSFNTIDFMFKSIIGSMINRYTTRASFEDFRQRLAHELDNYELDINSKTFNDFMTAYQIEDRVKNEKLVEEMKKNTKPLEFTSFMELIANMKKLSSLSKEETDERFNAIMRASLIKSLKTWHNPERGTNPVSTLSLVHYNKKLGHPFTVPDFLQEYYNSIFNNTSSNYNNQITANNLNNNSSNFYSSQPGSGN